MIKLAAQFVPLKTNAEKDGKDEAKKYGVRGYPTILFLDDKGEIVGRIGGYMPPGPFAEQMQRIADAQTELPKLEEALKKHPDDAGANAKIAGIYAMRGKIEDAEKAFARAEKAGAKGDEMARAANELGDHYQGGEKYDQAIGFFQKADAAAKDTKLRSYAKLSIAYCHMSKGDPEAAKKAAREVVDLKASDDDVKMAKRLLGEKVDEKPAEKKEKEKD